MSRTTFWMKKYVFLIRRCVVAFLLTVHDKYSVQIYKQSISSEISAIINMSYPQRHKKGANAHCTVAVLGMSFLANLLDFTVNMLHYKRIYSGITKKFSHITSNFDI